MNIKDINNIYQATVEAGEDWADKNAAADLLEENKKTLLAHLTLNHLEGSSKAAAETKALAEPGYQAHIEKMVAARKEANRAKVNYDSRKVWTELRRSVEATHRQEQKMIQEQV